VDGIFRYFLRGMVRSLCRGWQRGTDTIARRPVDWWLGPGLERRGPGAPGVSKRSLKKEKTGWLPVFLKA